MRVTLLGHDGEVRTERARWVVPVVAVSSACLVLFVGMVLLGVNTSCTSAWSCSSPDCGPCRVVSLSCVGGVAMAAALGVAAVYSPWPRRGRAVLYLVAMVATAVLTLLVAQYWSGPSGR